MQELSIYLKARIEWCQQQGRAATNVNDKQGWWAEEAGLVDALRGRPSPSASAAVRMAAIRRSTPGL